MNVRGRPGANAATIEEGACKRERFGTSCDTKGKESNDACDSALCGSSEVCSERAWPALDSMSEVCLSRVRFGKEREVSVDCVVSHANMPWRSSRVAVSHNRVRLRSWKEV